MQAREQHHDVGPERRERSGGEKPVIPLAPRSARSRRSAMKSRGGSARVEAVTLRWPLSTKSLAGLTSGTLGMVEAKNTSAPGPRLVRAQVDALAAGRKSGNTSAASMTLRTRYWFAKRTAANVPKVRLRFHAGRTSPTELCAFVGSKRRLTYSSVGQYSCTCVRDSRVAATQRLGDLRDRQADDQGQRLPTDDGWIDPRLRAPIAPHLTRAATSRSARASAASLTRALGRRHASIAAEFDVAIAPHAAAS